MRVLAYLAVAVLILFVQASSAHAQAAKSELVGEVRDQNGALVSNAKISLTDTATGLTSAKLADDGTFIMTNLKPGVYKVAVEADLDVVLEPGAVSELVTVVQDASSLRTESGSLGQVISNRKIVDLRSTAGVFFRR